MQNDLIVLAQCIGRRKGWHSRNPLIAVRLCSEKVLPLFSSSTALRPISGCRAVRATVQIAVVVIDAQLIGLSIDHKTSVGNPVAAASDDGSKQQCCRCTSCGVYRNRVRYPLRFRPSGTHLFSGSLAQHHRHVVFACEGTGQGTFVVFSEAGLIHNPPFQKRLPHTGGSHHPQSVYNLLRSSFYANGISPCDTVRFPDDCIRSHPGIHPMSLNTFEQSLPTSECTAP